ncbi:hypothetical protein FACS1894142_6730 [Spirochaetia bacterium]|nr:hypothetical protein FACS1894142_6730 [Spirochaetia bacterium]
MESNIFEIIKTKYGYKLTVPAINSLIMKISKIIILLFIGLINILVDFEDIIKPFNIMIKICICVIIICYIIDVIFYDFTIKITPKDIIFHIGKKLFLKKIKIGMNKIKEISINYESEEDEGLTYFYNLDLIDNEFNAYRIIRSTNYNNIYDFGKKIEKIVEKKLVDENGIEGYGNIFKKRIV